jgi:S1-C subfamily serine protease
VFSAEVLDQASKRVRPAIVQIVFQDLSPSAKRPGRTIIGSWFIVNTEGYVVTARHVINFVRLELSESGTQANDKWMSAGLAISAFKDPRGNIGDENFEGFDFDVVDEDISNDLALLKLRYNPFNRMLSSGIATDHTKPQLIVGTVTFDIRRVNQGTAIALAGYPFQEPTLVTNLGSITNSSTSAILTNAGSVINPSTNAPSEGQLLKDIYIADAIANPGNSGGPAYAVDSGLVIGVCLGRGERISGIMPARYVIELLKKHAVRWDERGS